MSHAPSPASAPLDDNEPAWRIILVGRGPIEARLRPSPEIELVRCRAPELAMGALADARRDAISGVGPPRAAVVICEGGVEDEERAGFLRALGMIDGSAPLVLVGGRPIAGAAWVPDSCDDRSLLAAIGAEHERAGASARTIAQRPGSAPDVAPIARPVAPARAIRGHGEQRMLQALLSGSDIVGPALDRVREAMRGTGIEVRPVSADGSSPSTGRGEVAIAAEHRGRVFAWLVGAAAAAGEMEQEARTLALWMAVGEQHAQLRSAAFTDPLTGAWNRRYLERFLDMALERARRDRRGVTLLLFDIDNFKHYNDTYGHPAGDEILCETVRLLTSVIRPTDRVCRIGGDEFAVVFDDPAGPRRTDSQPPSSIHEITRRFQRQITEHRFPKLGEQARAPLTISGGMVAFPWDAADAASLLERADRLILDSKSRGKNVICFGPGAQRALGCGSE